MARSKAPLNPGDLSGLPKNWLPTWSDFGPPPRPKPRPNPEAYISSRERSRGDEQAMNQFGGPPLKINPDDYISSCERGGRRGSR